MKNERKKSGYGKRSVQKIHDPDTGAFENLITSLIGGVIGLILSYVIVFRMRDWLLDIPSGSTIPINTLISIPIMLAVFAVCLVINLLSAGIPAYRASRMKIINSLNQNDN